MRTANVPHISTLPVSAALMGAGLSSNLFQRGAAASIFQKEKKTGDFTSNRIAAEAGKLLGGARDLVSRNSGNAFRARALESANPRAAGGSVPDGAPLKKFSVTIERTATSQNVVSDSMDTFTPLGLDRKFYDFTIRRGTDSHTFRIETDQLDTAEDVMNRIAEEINGAGAGLAAEVEKNNTARTARLEIRGIERSDMSSVAITDASGDLMRRLGISTSQYAGPVSGGLLEIEGPASFTVNGQRFFSGTNRVALYENNFLYRSIRIGRSATPEELYDTWVENGGQLPDYLPTSSGNGTPASGRHVADLELKGSATNETAMEVKPDAGEIYGAIENFVADRNRVLETLNASPSSPLKQIRNFLEDTLAVRRNEASGAGVENDGAETRINEDMMKENLENRPEDIETLFGSPGGIADKTAFGALKLLYSPALRTGAMSYLQILPATGYNYSGFADGDTF